MLVVLALQPTLLNFGRFQADFHALDSRQKLRHTATGVSVFASSNTIFSQQSSPRQNSQTNT